MLKVFHLCIQDIQSEAQCLLNGTKQQEAGKGIQVLEKLRHHAGFVHKPEQLSITSELQANQSPKAGAKVSGNTVSCEEMLRRQELRREEQRREQLARDEQRARQVRSPTHCMCMEMIGCRWFACVDIESHSRPM